VLFVGQFLEFESAGDLDDAVQAAAADRVRRSYLAEGWAVDVEEGVAGSTQSQAGCKNSG